MAPSEKRNLEGDAPTTKRQRLSSPSHPVKPVGDCMHLCTAVARASLPAALESDISWRNLALHSAQFGVGISRDGKVLLKLSPHRLKGHTLEALETGSPHPLTSQAKEKSGEIEGEILPPWSHAALSTEALLFQCREQTNRRQEHHQCCCPPNDSEYPRNSELPHDVLASR